MFVNDNSQHLKILLVAHRFYKDSKAGTETLVEDIATELMKKGHSIFIMAVSNDPLEKNTKVIKRDDGIYCISIPYFSQKNIVDNWKELEKVQAQRINNAIKELSISFDIVHIFHFARIGLDFFSLPIFKKSKFFVTLTDYSIFCPDYQLFNRKEKCICLTPGNTVKCSVCMDNIISPQIINEWKIHNINFINEHAQMIYTQTKAQKQYIIKSGIDKEILSPMTAAYKIPPDWEDIEQNQTSKYMFGFFGRISPEKGLDIFLKAYLKSNVTNAKLLICGSFDDNQEYNSFIKKLMVQTNNITYSQPVPLKELGELISSVNYVVFPSIWNENHSILLTYACALGKQVFCSAVPALKELKYPQLNLVDNYNNISSWETIINKLQATKTNPKTLNIFEQNIKNEFSNFINALEKDYFS